MGKNFPWRIAAPSFVIPGTVAENWRFLAQNRFETAGVTAPDEVAVVLFESEGCLAYTEEDLAPDLPGLGLSCHTHLPLDLPWTDGGEAVFRIVRALLGKVDFLAPRVHVLHPPVHGEPAESRRLLREFLGCWKTEGLDPRTLLVENIRGAGLAELLPVIYEEDAGICFDIGHALAFGQLGLLDMPQAAARIRMIHAYGPDSRGRHGPLRSLDGSGRAKLREALRHLPEGGTVVLENFRWEDFRQSAEALPSVLGPEDG